MENDSIPKGDSAQNTGHAPVAAGAAGHGEDGSQSAGPSRADDRGKPANKRSLFILIVVVLIIVILGVGWWFLTRNQESTDDAFTEGNTVSMAAQVSGYVEELHIQDNAYVKRGDLLLRIDPRDYVTRRDRAKAQLGLAQAQYDQAQVQLTLAQTQYPAQLDQAKAQEASAAAALQRAEQSYRRQRSVNERATTQENIDAATAQLRDARATLQSAQAQVRIAGQASQQVAEVQTVVAQRKQQVEQARAELAQAELDLSRTEIRAPSDGWIARRNVQVGTLVQQGSAMFTLVMPERWITANFKESQLDRMQPGDKVDIEVDAYPSLKLSGHVDSIQQGSGSRFSAFPAENATGNFVKVVQRVPVKIVIDEGLDANHPLPLGLSVIPTVTVQ